MFLQLRTYFLLTLELKTTKHPIIYTNVLEDLFVRKNNYKIMNITIAESTENVYHVTRQNLYFDHALYNKNKLKITAKEWTGDKKSFFSK